VSNAPSGTDVAIVGAGVAGVLVAAELSGSTRDVTLIERGAFKSHADQVRDGQHTVPIATAESNHEAHPTTPGDQWGYEYGVGGAGLHWGGVSPRLLPSDFELRSRYGVGRDWPFSYAELEPYYALAERALSVSGSENALFGPAYRPPLPPHPFSPTDLMLRPYLRPYHSLPQARPTRSVGGRPACCGSGSCSLCPVDARYSPLHTLEALRGRPGLKLRDRTVVARIRRGGGDWRLECIGPQGSRTRLTARTVVLAANGFENPAILLRSRLGGADVGRWLNDHLHEQFRIEVERPTGAGRGSTIATGISYAWADGPFRSKRGSVLVYPDNRGPYMGDDLVRAIAGGKRGRGLQNDVTARFKRSIVLDVIGEDLPQEERSVELSSTRDALGLPLNRVRYPPDSEYLERSRRVVLDDLLERLRPLGARVVHATRFGGGHMLGTCRMGRHDGVVDEHGRLHGAAGLYVVGGSSFPSYSAAHPTLTIAALAIRLGRHLDELVG
jgi:glucose dehydrogenase